MTGSFGIDNAIMLMMMLLLLMMMLMVKTTTTVSDEFVNIDIILMMTTVAVGVM